MRRGFGLLEILVAVGLFATVATVAVGSVVMLLRGQKKAYYVQTNQDNVRFTIEAIAREIRTGVSYTQNGVTNNSLVYYDNPAMPATCVNMANRADQPPVSNLHACIQFVNARGELVFIKQSKDLNECGASSLGLTSVSCITKSSTPIPMGNDPVAILMAAFQPMTAPEVSIESLKFLVAGELSGAADTKSLQPRVTIVLRAATPGAGLLKSSLSVQTTVSQLKLDQ